MLSHDEKRPSCKSQAHLQLQFIMELRPSWQVNVKYQSSQYKLLLEDPKSFDITL